MAENSVLQTLSSQAGRKLMQEGKGRAGDDLAWAWFNLSTADRGRTIIGRLANGEMDQLQAIFGQPWDVLEVAAMSLAFEDVMTAIVLCTDAVLLICGELPDPRGQFYGLGDLKKRRGKLAAPAAIRAWIDQLLQHSDLTLLEDCRHALTHRTVRRHPRLRLVSGRPARRALTEITTLHGQDPPQSRGSIGELIPRLVSFGETQLESLCQAVLTS